MIQKVFWRAAVALLFWVGLAQGAVRLAVVCPEDSERARQLTDLVIVEVGRLPEVEILDRTLALERLREENLTRLGLISEETAMDFGRRLRVDVFAFLETSPEGRDAIGLVVFDVATGVRLWDVTLPAGSVEGQRRHVVEGLSAALRKKRYLADGVRAICFVSVRNADLPRAEDSVLDGVGRLVERRLNTASNLVVLERRRLEWLNLEQAEAPETPRPLLRGAVVIAEVEFARDATATGARMRVRLTTPQGELLGTLDLPAQLADAVGTAERMASGVCRLLDGGCLDLAIDRDREAQHFAREAEHALGHLRYEPALRAAEAAYALNPAHEAIAGMLVKVLLETARAELGALPLAAVKSPFMTMSENQAAAVYRASRALQMVRDHLQVFVPPKDLHHRNRHPVINANTESALTQFLYAAIARSLLRDPLLHGLLRDLQAQTREMFREEFRRYSRAVTGDGAFRAFTTWLGNVPLSYGRVCAPTAEAWVDDLTWMLDQWLDMAGRHRLYNDLSGTVHRLLLGIQNHPMQYWLDRYFSLEDGWSLAGPEYERLDRFFDGMSRHTNPVIRLYGQRGRLWAQRGIKSLEDETLLPRYEEVRQAGWAMLKEEIPPDHRAHRLMCYRGLLDVIALLPDPKQRAREQQALFDLMLALGEVSPEVLRSVPSWPEIAGDSAGVHLAWSAVRRLREALDEKKLRVLWGREGALYSQLWLVETALHKKAPPSSAAPPTLPARLLIAVTNVPGLRQISPPRIEGEAIWVAGVRQRESGYDYDLEVYRLDPRNGRWEVVAGTKNMPRGIGGPPRINRPPSRGDGFWAIPTDRQGVVLVFEDGSPARQLGKASGLPSDRVHSVLCVGRRLYIGLGAILREGYLVSYQLDAGESETLCSTLRKTAQSPLDNISPPYDIELLAWDEPRQRLLFLVHFGPWCPGKRPSVRGLWAYSPRDNSWRLLQPFWTEFETGHPLEDGRWLLFSSSAAVVFDPDQDTTRLLYRAYLKSAGPGLTPSTALMALERYGTGPFALLEGELWTTTPFSRISRDGHQQTYYTLPAEVQGGPGPSWRWLAPWASLRCLLVGWPDRLWLVEVPLLKPSDLEPRL